MEHTRLTVRNFFGFATTIFLISLVSVGFGAVDLAMIAHKGVDHVAAVGQGELIVAGLLAFFGGFIDTFLSRMAMAESKGELTRRLPTMLAALFLIMVVSEILAILLAIGVGPLMTLTQQSASLTPLVHDYVAVRVESVALVIFYSAIGGGLRICGLKNVSLWALIVGFGVNGALDWLFLYTRLSSSFASPESAVAIATLLSQVLMTCITLVVFVRQIRTRGGIQGRPDRAEAVGLFWSMLRTGPGIGLRHLNDYMGSIVPMMFVGTFSVQALAAYVLAAKVYTIFCRVPQACVQSTFMFYSFEVGRETAPRELAASSRRLLAYAAAPTAAGTVLILATAPLLIRLFGGGGVQSGLAFAMLLAFMATVPLYIFEASYGEMLTVHQRGGLLALSSSLTSWLLLIPLTAFGVFVLKSASLGVAIGGVVATGAQVWIFGRALYKDHWVSRPARITEAQVA